METWLMTLSVIIEWSSNFLSQDGLKVDQFCRLCAKIWWGSSWESSAIYCRLSLQDNVIYNISPKQLQLSCSYYFSSKFWQGRQGICILSRIAGISILYYVAIKMFLIECVYWFTCKSVTLLVAASGVDGWAAWEGCCSIYHLLWNKPSVQQR